MIFYPLLIAGFVILDYLKTHIAYIISNGAWVSRRVGERTNFIYYRTLHQISKLYLKAEFNYTCAFFILRTYLSAPLRSYENIQIFGLSNIVPTNSTCHLYFDVYLVICFGNSFFPPLNLFVGANSSTPD